MKLWGKIIKQGKTIKESKTEINGKDKTLTVLLEECLIDVCKQLDISVPLWLSKNTGEFIKFKKTYFLKEQFIEDFKYDRFEIKVE